MARRAGGADTGGVADVLGSGPRERTGPAGSRRRWPTPLVAVLVGAVAVGLAVRSGGGGDAAPRPQESLSVVVRPAPLVVRSGPPPPPAVFRLDGTPGAGPAGVRLLVGGRRPSVLDTGTGRLTPVGGVLQRPRDQVGFDRSGGLTVALVGNPDLLRPRAVALAGGRAVYLGPALAALPMRDGTVLTEDCAGVSGSGPCTLTARTAAGAVRWRRTVGRQLELVRDTPAGLLVRAYQGDVGGVVRLEDARTGTVDRVVGRTYDVLAANDRHVLFRSPGCDSGCALRLADLDRPGYRDLPRQAGRAGAAAISPDGDRVAVGFTGLGPGDQSPSLARDGYVTVVDVHEARVREMPGVATAAASTPLPVWAPDGRLLVAVSDGGVGRVAVWRPGDRAVTVLPTRLAGLAGEPGMLAGPA